MSETTIDYVLSEMHPCEDGAKWLVTQPDLATAWEVCHRSDWMLWLCKQLDILTDEQDLVIQLAVLDTPLPDGRRVIELITDPRSLAFIEMKRQRLAGVEIEPNTWETARDAAWSAADSAARFAAAWSVALFAALSAARSARSSARDAAQAWQADKIREIVGNPFTREAS